MGKPPTPLHNIIIQATTNLLTNNIYFLVCDLLEARIGEKKIVCAYYNHQNHFILTIMSTSLFCTLSWMENYEKLPIKSGILAQKCYGAVVRIAEFFGVICTKIAFVSAEFRCDHHYMRQLVLRLAGQ